MSGAFTFTAKISPVSGGAGGSVPSGTSNVQGALGLFNFSATIPPVSRTGIPGSDSSDGVQEAFRHLSVTESGGSDTCAVGPPFLSLRSIFNASAAANRLPAELVIKIFTSGAWTSWRELLRLAHICRHWRDVTLGTPQLWADAIDDLFKYESVVFDRVRCLPTLLAWSSPYPLRLTIPGFILSRLRLSGVFGSHFSRLSRLSIQVPSAENIKTALAMVREEMPSLETLYIIASQAGPDSSPASPSIWHDQDLPRLHTLSISSFDFTPAVAVKSLKTLILHGRGPRSLNDFLDSLSRCAAGLTSLTLQGWSHKKWIADASNPSLRCVHLPSLRRLGVTLDGSEPPTSFVKGLSFPPDVMIDLDWTEIRGNTHALLPKESIGLHAPPFFDSMCLFMSEATQTVTLDCFVSGTERLRVRERPNPPYPALRAFLEEHRSGTVTELAIHLDGERSRTIFIHGDLLQQFVRHFPNLRRLELLGRSIRDVKLQTAKGLLTLLSHPEVPSPADRTLAVVLQVSTPSDLDSEELDPKHPDSADNKMLAALREQLDAIEALLKTHVADGGPRLHRLELCITDLRNETSMSHYAFRIADVPPSPHWNVQLVWFYLPRFEALVDEVVFLGGVPSKRQETSVPGGTPAHRHVGVKTSDREEGARKKGRFTRGR